MKKKYISIALALLLSILLTGCGATGQGLSKALEDLKNILFDDPTWVDRWFVSKEVLNVLSDKLGFIAAIVAILGFGAVGSGLIRDDDFSVKSGFIAIIASAALPHAPQLITFLGRIAFTRMHDPLSLKAFADAGGWLTKDMNVVTLQSTINFVMEDLPRWYVLFMWWVVIRVVWDVIDVALHGRGKSLTNAAVWILAYMLLPLFLSGTVDMFAATQPATMIEATVKNFNLQFAWWLKGTFVGTVVLAFFLSAVGPEFSVPTLITVISGADNYLQKKSKAAQDIDEEKNEKRRSKSHLSGVVEGFAASEVANWMKPTQEPKDHEGEDKKKEKSPSAEQLNEKMEQAEQEDRSASRDSRSDIHSDPSVENAETRPTQDTHWNDDAEHHGVDEGDVIEVEATDVSAPESNDDVSLRGKPIRHTDSNWDTDSAYDEPQEIP